MPEGGCETQPGVTFHSHPSADAALAALAGTQQAILKLEQICELGLGAAAVRQRAAAGRLHRQYRGVYSIVPRNLLTREGRWLAAVFAAGPGAVLSHRSAGALHGLRPFSGVTIDVTIPTRTMRKQPGIRIHRSTTLTEKDVTIVDGIPCTTVARTLLDLADVENRRGLERAFDQSEIAGAFDLRAIEDQLERNFTRRAAGLVRAVLEEHYIGRTPTWNELEEAVLTVCRAAGVPEPEVNQWLVLPDGGQAIRPDFMWRRERVVLEADGRATHGTSQRFERDRRKDQRMIVAGWRSIRTTWRQVFRRPDELRVTLATVLLG